METSFLFGKLFLLNGLAYYGTLILVRLAKIRDRKYYLLICCTTKTRIADKFGS